mmetsp:Transcript_8494/g.13401  ORF Transcript_8494/g.13401 Transcript_8494/m.13401 type:complete len:114 (-) Transcript_8494:381-722(-)|eukprot:CAMPEP_0181364270 /NCGR_PEP_ID=MMETSP1106-20121128/9282_1 /TAXON_ID=81844 /ORGANISM="Mantoniella antarctica, Strain SL-175" /LENGTH=113 /DNA_ID=CAMNT_0023478943 /DNA_START=196 /DNA_END=537 /DNA_ORIENTATION=+
MPSPVEVQIQRAGDGKYYPKKGETVAVHYTLKLDNGKEVDNTYKRKQPFRFKVASGQVVKGWDEAVKQLSVGEKASCTFPASLAYGAKGFPGLIPPHSNLHVIVELVAIMISD